MASASGCSINGCKRAATCLCHHCKKNVCAKHFNEHQTQINDELLPLTDRLNQLKMKLRTEEHRNGPLAMLKMWRDMKYKEIDQEYNQKVGEFNRKVSKQDEEVTQTIGKIEELINEGEVSFQQIKQLKKDIGIMENQVNQLMMTNEQTQISSENNADESDLVNTYVLIGHQKCLVKGKVFCGNEYLYALESDMPLTGYDGLCPQCRTAHVSLHSNRGFYILSETLHEYVKSRVKNNPKFDKGSE